MTLRLGPIPALVAKEPGADSGAVAAMATRARVEAWVRGTPPAAEGSEGAAAAPAAQGLSVEELRSFQGVVTALLAGGTQVIHVDGVPLNEPSSSA